MAITPGAVLAGATIYYSIAVSLFLIVASWALYAKADQPGWTVLIPVYNTYVYLQIVGRPGWWLVLYFIPVVGSIVGIINMFDLARVFDRDILFGFGLLFLAPIFVPILAFGEAEYVGDAQGSWDSVG